MVARQFNRIRLLKEFLSLFSNLQHTNVIYILLQILVDQYLANHRLPKVAILLLPFSINIQAKMAIALDILIFNTTDHIHKAAQAKTFVGLRGGFKNDLTIVSTLNRL